MFGSTGNIAGKRGCWRFRGRAFGNSVDCERTTMDIRQIREYHIVTRTSEFFYFIFGLNSIWDIMRV